MEKRHVYILKGNRYYVGSTNDVNRRLKEHKRGHTHSTKRIGEWSLVKLIECQNKTEARSLETKIKKSGHIERFVGEQNQGVVAQSVEQ